MKFLQSHEWMEFQKSLGREVLEVGGLHVFKHPLPFGKNYLYIPAGWPVAGIAELAKKEKSIFVKAEPMQDDIASQFVRLGYQKSSKNIQPHKTVILDLTQSEEELLGAMHHKTRYNIRVAERNGIQIKESQDIHIFWKLMQKTTARDKFNSYPKDYYQKLLKLCKLYIAWHGDKAVAAALVLTHESKAYYLHGASDHEFRNLMAPYALHWSITLNLKRLNFKLYDLWGIDAQKWPGVTRFKLGWGGRTIEYPGAFDLVVSKWWYLAYNISRGK